MISIKNLDYEKWCADNKIDELLGVDLNAYGKVQQKKDKGLYETVDSGNKTPFPPEMDDLVRLHYLVRSRRVTTVLEFGVGKSTLVITDAIKKNQEDYGDFVKNNLRRANPFEVHSVDNYQEWIDECKHNFPSHLLEIAHFHLSEVEMTTFNGRVCTMYQRLPNICPDFIYLDGPDQFGAKGDIRGISTISPDRVPMAADILLFEPFLLPGTLIVIDGRTANARFLKNNLQRDWEYQDFIDEDIRAFELIEPPLGKINAKQIEFCLGVRAE